MLLEQDRDDIIEEFLEGQPRAEYWRELREALAGRLTEAVAYQKTLDTDTPDYAEATERVEELREQVTALHLEEAVTQFVEESVAATVNRPRRPRLPDGFEPPEGYGAFDDEFAIDPSDLPGGTR